MHTVRNFSKGDKNTDSSKQFVAGDQALLQHFNLSRNGSFSTPNITAESINAASRTASNFLRTVLSTVTSPAYLNVVVVYRDVDLGGTHGWCLNCASDPVCFRHRLREDRCADVLR